MVAPAYNSRTWEVHTGGSEVQGHPHLHREFEARLGYVRLTTTEWGKNNVCTIAPNNMTSTILPISTSRFTRVQTVATWSSIEGIDSYLFSHSCFHKHIGCTCFFIVTDITEMKIYALVSCGAWLSGGGGEMSRVSRRSGLQLTVLLVLLALLFSPAVCEHAS